MSKNYLTEAFKEMELLEESKSFGFNKQGAEDLGKFLEDDTLDDFEVIIDPEATNKDELQDSYIGKVILGCDVCHSMIYKDPTDIIVDEESHMANVGELCPYCFTGDGYKVVGKVAPYEDITVEAPEDVEVKVNGKTINSVEAEEDDNLDEAIEKDQKYPVAIDKAPAATINESIAEKRKQKLKENTIKEELSNMEKIKRAFPEINFDAPVTKVPSKRKVGAVKESVATELEEELSNSEKLFRAFPELREPIKESVVSSEIMSTEEFLDWHDNKVNPKDDFGKLKQIYHIFQLNGCSEDADVDVCYDACDDKQKREIMDIILTESCKKSIKEGMEDISITTDDQVIKVKATPRADKETIEPVTEEEVAEMQQEETPTETEEEIVEEEPVEEQEVEMDEIDEEGMDELGESYLRQVYENVNSFKTSRATLKKDKMIIEGIITFNNGKKAKTQFLFEAKEMTKKGKLKFLGENKNLSKNKKAFTLTGSINNKKLMVESLNYNYSGIDSATGKAKRLYGTVKVSK